jgi:hypothetical protein
MEAVGMEAVGMEAVGWKKTNLHVEHRLEHAGPVSLSPEGRGPGEEVRDYR